MQAKGLKYEHQVAELLGFKRVAFSERKKRNSPPIAEIELLCHKESINTNWILCGEGEMFIDAGQKENVQGPAISTEEAALLAMVRGDKELLRDVIKYTEKEKLLKTLIKEQQKKQAG